MATYRALYGPSSGPGPLGPFVGNPARFKREFDDGGGKWLVANNVDGLPFYLLISGHNEALYNWEEVAKRNWSGSAHAYDFFRQVEQSNAQRFGLTVDENRLLYASPGLLRKGKPPRVWHRTREDFVGPPHYWGSSIDEGDATQVNAADVSRAVLVEFKIPTSPEPGAKTFTIYATVNLWLRIGYITGFAGEVVGGDDWIAEAIRTIVDIALIVIGYVTGNVALMKGAAADIVATWYGYAEEKAAAAAAAQGKGVALGRLAQLHPQLGQLDRMPTAGELAQANTQGRGLLLAVLIAVLLAA